MLATLSMSPSINFRDSNSASSPLPLLPRRPSASSRVSPTTPPKNPIQLLVQQPTPPDEPQETENSSSSSSSSAGRTAIRVKRVRGVRPPELSTPIPARRQQSDTEDELHTPRPALVYAPGHLRAVSTSRIPITTTTTTTTTPKPADSETPRIVRKKSGQPIKSSLKSSTPKVRGSLAVVIGGPGSSKSAPSTPTHGTRSVHFDTQLEHVKLFLAEQKPLAVSRDGSPTDDTSGTDGDFPEWIFGRGASMMPKKGRLEMSVDVPRAAGEVDVKLQSLALTEDETAIAGSVAVRNLAFEKWVAVRFTFDGWQTTSEVTARHARTMPGGAVDVFGFSIRLNDLLARIEGKEMMLAVRYASAGREIWDNNGGGNYLARFRRAPREEEKEKEKKGEGVEDLRERLERVKVQDAKKNDEAADKFKTGASLAERYDFGAAARIPWRPSTTTTTATTTATAPPPAPPPPMHTRAQSHPVFDHTPSPPGSTIPWPAQRNTPVKATKPSLGSPRDLSEDAAFRPAPYVTSDDSNSDEAPFAFPRFDHHHHHHPPAPEQQQGQQQRNHQRGYFDVPVWGRDFGTSALRRTPPGTPRLLRSVDDATPTPVGTPGGGGRFNSFPPLDPASGATRIGLGVGVGIAFELDGRLLKPVGSSEASTPAFTSSEGTSPGGGTSPMSPADFSDLGEVSVSSVEGNVSPSPSTTYHTFLDRFCFYTGPEIEGLPRTQSASSVEELLSSPRLQPFPLAPLVKKQRRGSSESTTPLASSRSATPVAA